jgi:hypothetical protein
MREDLIGYVLNALEPADHARVEEAVARDAQLQRDVRKLRAFLELLECDRDFESPPPGLAERTCKLVARRVTIYDDRRLGVPTRWRVLDLMVAAGILAAASMLFFPAVAQSRFRARVTACQGNLRVLGQALASYSQFHDGYFPVIPVASDFGAAGIYGPTLLELGFLDSPRWLVCPGGGPAQGLPRVPTLGELRRAAPEAVPELRRRMGGGYAYGLGYIQDGSYCCLRNEGRPCVPIMADAPGDSLNCGSANHGCGQNVLFEDLHVMYLVGCEYFCGDHIYLNRLGVMAAGIGPNDVVLGRSDTHPTSALAGVFGLPKGGQPLKYGGARLRASPGRPQPQLQP